MYLSSTGIHPSLYSVIERACAPEKAHRIKTTDGLKQAIAQAFDILLGRRDAVGACEANLELVLTRLTTSRQYVASEVNAFLDSLALLNEDQKDVLCFSLRPDLMAVISESEFSERRPALLAAYGHLVYGQRYKFEFAERIAECMSNIFYSAGTTVREKADALKYAIFAAHSQTRFAAMRTCDGMICSIDEQPLALEVRDVLLSSAAPFVSNIEASRCRHPIVAQTIRQLKGA